MTQITNLNKFRKQKARNEKEIKAQNNRLFFGTPKHLRQASKIEQMRNNKSLDGQKLEKEDKE